VEKNNNTAVRRVTRISHVNTDNRHGAVQVLAHYAEHQQTKVFALRPQPRLPNNLCYNCISK